MKLTTITPIDGDLFVEAKTKRGVRVSVNTDQNTLLDRRSFARIFYESTGEIVDVGNSDKAWLKECRRKFHDPQNPKKSLFKRCVIGLQNVFTLTRKPK